ncbi:hypothetical protein ACJMK2_010791 [Sinanodonta woodiana]|uniref:Proteasome assembly chaperone 2 n=1 Tax=Sinanodonta woodiana TaxID=1069815 RepID=A0ABD3VGV7_SINWO
MFISSEDASPNFEEKTLILTSVSVGNVGQLSADLLISTLSMKRIGYIHHESILPMVGNDPFASVGATTCNIVTSCEVYESMQKKLVVIQQRAPFIKGKRPCFRNWLVQWIKDSKFKMVVILTSTHAHERIDVQLQGCNAGVPAAVLLIFCAEGDNVQEAIILANQLNIWLQLTDFHKKTLDNTWTLTEQSLNNWKIPMSWKLFFGSKVDQTLFH